VTLRNLPYPTVSLRVCVNIHSSIPSAPNRYWKYQNCRSQEASVPGLPSVLCS